ncbi:hypothetical protein AX15_001657 [Amanita polypyramis BW_CC]|nr:hypothetical protein AX15_001657 [Amanita polypyramis BW_CC]
MATTYSQPGPSTLPRGRACATCRRRKTKCDGAQPVCGQCLRAKKPEDCEYTVGNEPTQNQLLEERIRVLEARIQDLTSPARANSNVTLHQPYQPTSESIQHHTSLTPSSATTNNSLEPPKNEAIHLIDRFLVHASEFGFFLDGTRFRESMALDLPLGHPYRPFPALIMATYLVGIFLTPDENFAAREKQTLAAAVQMSAQTLSNSHPRRVMQGIQAELMLACYFFAQNRLLEGQYHLATAASTALATGLLKTSKTQSEFSDLLMPPMKDVVEERERTNACWTIYYLDYGWAAALNAFPNLKCTPDALRGTMGPPAIAPPKGDRLAHVNGSNCTGSTLSDVNGSSISNGHSSPISNSFHGRSPSLNSYNGSPIPNGIRGSPVHNGTGGTSINGSCPSVYDGIGDATTLTQKAEAAYWWKYATDTIQSWRPDMSCDEIAVFSRKINSAISSLDALITSLMSADRMNATQMDRKHLLFAHHLTHGAQMLLHRVLINGSEGRCLASAASIFKLATSVPSYSPGYVDPFIGVLWNNASQVLIKEASRLRSMRLAKYLPNSTEEEQIHALYTQALQIMNNASGPSTFLRKQVRELTEAYQTYVAGELLA